MKLLLTAVGKRVQLIKHLQTNFEVIGVDISQLAPASFFVDEFYLVPRFTDENYIDELIKLCKTKKVQLLIPLMEREFIKLAKARKQFEEVGTRLVLSNEKIIDICNDKLKMADFFEKKAIAHARNLNEVPAEKVKFPVIIKPVNGMGSQGVFKINTIKELNFFKNYVDKPIIETCLEGEEYTVDVLCDLEGNPVYIVPRLRIETRSGEVSKSRVVLDQIIIAETKKLIDKLSCIKIEGIGLMGPLTIQCFKTPENQVVFIEINPRFGGGVPLSFSAGADYAKMLYRMIKGEKVIGSQDKIKELTMLRYDEAVYIEENGDM